MPDMPYTHDDVRKAADVVRWVQTTRVTDQQPDYQYAWSPHSLDKVADQLEAEKAEKVKLDKAVDDLAELMCNRQETNSFSSRWGKTGLRDAWRTIARAVIAEHPQILGGGE